MEYKYYSLTMEGNIGTAVNYINKEHPDWDIVNVQYLGNFNVVIVYKISDENKNKTISGMKYLIDKNDIDFTNIAHNLSNADFRDGTFGLGYGNTTFDYKYLEDGRYEFRDYYTKEIVAVVYPK